MWIIIIAVLIVLFIGKDFWIKTLDKYVIRSLMRVWGKLVQFLLIMVIVWISYKLAMVLLRGLI